MRGVDVPEDARPAVALAQTGASSCSAGSLLCTSSSGRGADAAHHLESGGGAGAPDHANRERRDGPVGKARPLVGRAWWAKSSRVRASVPSATTAAIR